jgi:hypothetical protein
MAVRGAIAGSKRSDVLLGQLIDRDIVNLHPRAQMTQRDNERVAAVGEYPCFKSQAR